MTLAENLVVVSIVAVIGTATFATYSKQYQHQKADQAVSLVRTALAAADSLANNRQSTTTATASYQGIAAADLVNIGKLPANLLNPFGGGISVALASANSPQSDQDIFVLTLSGVPRAGCARLTASLAADVFYMFVNGQRVPLRAASAGAYQVPVMPYVVSNLCTDENNALAFHHFRQPDLAMVYKFGWHGSNYDNERNRIAQALNARSLVLASTPGGGNP